MDILEELEELIKFIKIKYKELDDQWKNSKYYIKINMKNNTVFDLTSNNEMLDMIFNYRELINANNVQLVLDFTKYNSVNAKVNTRVKNKNSVTYKIENYCKNHENGNVPINKCINDLFGVRFISKENLTYEQISEYISNKFSDLKCINAIRQDYKAIHIYFKKDNFSFPWELQIWNEENELSNIEAHEKYKQDYVRWEKENKGGKI